MAYVEPMNRTEEGLWTIGELAAEAGVTVRALRHYDRMGLLVPSERSEGGHRRYSHSDVTRLYRIVALRTLDFSLADIATALESEPGALPELVRDQLERVQSGLALQARLRDRLERLVSVLENNEAPTPDDLLDALEALMTVRLDQIYTRTGDSGETELADGQRVAKTDPRLRAADLEEISAQLAAAVAVGNLEDVHAGWLRRIQNDLLDLGADIGHPLVEATSDLRPRVTPDYVQWLEDACDQANAELPPVDSFVVPGGPSPAPELHLARTACRRVERLVFEIPDINPEVGRYLNRLSDLLFVLARTVSRDSELLWRPGAHAPRESHG
jgi:cob(I)alamin adenosyltransferase